MSLLQEELNKNYDNDIISQFQFGLFDPKLIEKGVQLKAFSPEIMAAAQKATFEIYEENASKNESFKKVYQQWKKFREQVFNWNKVNELSFTLFVEQNQ